MQADREGMDRGRIAKGQKMVAVGAAAGIAAPILFTLLVIAQGLRHPDYSHTALAVSALAAWPGGWIQNLNFVATGLLMIAFALGLHCGIRPGRGGAVGPALLALGGIGLVVAGLFPWRLTEGAFIVPAGHVVGAVLSFLSTAGGFVVVSWRMAGDPASHRLSVYVFATGIAIIALFLIFGIYVRPPNAPLHPWLGLVQRVTVAVWFVCTLVLAIRLLRILR